MIRISNKLKLWMVFDRVISLFFSFSGKKKAEVFSEDYSKILIVELWGLGDLTLMSSILTPLRKRYPKSKIILLSSEKAKELFEDNPIIDEFIEFQAPWRGYLGKYRILSWPWPAIFNLIKRLRREHIDLILDARGDVRNNLLLFFSGAKRRVGYDWSGGEYLLTDCVKFDYLKRHRIEAWLELLRYLGISETNSAKPQLFLSSQETDSAKILLKEQGMRDDDLLIGIHPYARIPSRAWPLERFLNLAQYLKEKYSAKVLFFQDIGQKEEDLLSRSTWPVIRLTLRPFMALLNELDLFICNEGGPMHLAAALNVEVLAVFGPTEPKWFGPFGENTKIIIKEGISCRPCFDYCNYPSSHCLEAISFEDALITLEQNFNKILSR